MAVELRDADGYSNLGVTLNASSRYDDALAAFHRALRHQPQHADALFNLGNHYQDVGRLEEAIEAYRRALEVDRQRVDAINNLGNALLATGRVEEAAECYRRAIAIDPQSALAHLNLGVAYAEQDRAEEAARCYEVAARLQPEKALWKMRPLSLCPTIFPSVEELDRYRGELEARLDACLAKPLQLDWRELPSDGFMPPFNLSHHGRNNRQLKSKFASLFERHFPQRRPRLRTGRPRIGFLVTRNSEGGFLRGMAGIIERLDPARFGVVVLCSESVLAMCRAGVRRGEVDWVPFPENFPHAVERITAAECDVIDHWQIGTDPLNYFLPFARLAPVQCTGWGTHATTGIAAVDYYLSSQLIEAEGAHGHYTESLHRFSTFPTYQRRIPRPPRTERSYFGLPERGTLYLCPPRMPKFHPDLDAVLRGVLDGDPHGFLVILEGRSPHTGELLRQRFTRSLGNALRRVIFLPRQEPADFYRLMSVADVFLDTLHYSAGLMGHDAFSLGLPIVTLPGEFNVGRYALGYYRRMGIEELIATSPAEYIQLAVRLGTDRDYRESMRALISERSEPLFEDMQAVRGYEEFLELAIARARETGC